MWTDAVNAADAATGDGDGDCDDGGGPGALFVHSLLGTCGAGGAGPRGGVCGMVTSALVDCCIWLTSDDGRVGDVVVGRGGDSAADCGRAGVGGDGDGGGGRAVVFG